jgi:hypothetical protein
MNKIPVPVLFETDPIYVAGMLHHQSLDTTMKGIVDLGKPAAIGDDDFVDAQAVAASTEYLYSDLVSAATGAAFKAPILVDEDLFGRTIRITSTDAGDLTIYGRDYLNQMMSETVTCTAGTVETTKAFKYVDRIVTAANLAGDLSMGYGTDFGLPFTATDTAEEFVDNAAASAPTITAPDTTDPATATTGDPRGTVDTTTAPDGTKHISLTVTFHADGDYGLHGVPQA